MPVLSDKVKEQVADILKALPSQVNVKMFTQEVECQYCSETRELVEELSSISDKVNLEVFDFQNDKDKAEELGIDKIPAIAITGKDKDYGVRFYGIPSGYEFTSLLEGIKHVANKEGGQDNEVPANLKDVKGKVNLKVFVTPTCPYCPGAVIAAHKFAIENENVHAEMIEASEFPHLANKYEVMGVPRTVINDKDFVEGAVPENMLVEKILGSAG